MKYTIEKNIPIPGRALTLPLGEMELGDSFIDTETSVSTLRTVLSRCKKLHPDKDFTSVVVDNGIRVWRTK